MTNFNGNQITRIRALWRQGSTLEEIAAVYLADPREVAAVVNGRRSNVTRPLDAAVVAGR